LLTWLRHSQHFIARNSITAFTKSITETYRDPDYPSPYRYIFTSYHFQYYPSIYTYISQVFSSLQFLGAFAKLRDETIRFIMSVCPSVLSVRLSAWNSAPTGRIYFKFDFSKICPENSSFIKIWQEWWLLYMKTKIYFL